MIQRLVAFAVRMPFIVLTTAMLIVVGGLYSYRQLNVEAYPNPVPPMVEVITQPNGWRTSAQLAESAMFFTFPEERFSMANHP